MKKVVCSGDCMVDSPRAILRLGVTENGWAKVNYQRSECNWRWRRPYDVLAEATHGEIRGLATQKQSVDRKGSGLGGVPQCHRGESIEREERDADARQQIVEPWANSAMVPQRQD
ncbi:hypothetical protein BHM03_00047533 [Ensete ventricosum]|nr:hypothetical protein BHM03_00047533 [Ensete ventricosum]